MRKILPIWILALLICTVSVMAVCSNDGNCTRYVAMDMSPCIDNIRLNTPVLINITTASCNSDYTLISTTAGLTTCPVCVLGVCPTPTTSAFINYSGFVADWINRQSGNNYNYWTHSVLTSSIKSNCENVSMRITLYRDQGMQEQVLQDWTPFNLSWQLYLPAGAPPVCTNLALTGIHYPTFGLMYNTTMFNKTGDYIMRVQVRGNVNLTASEYNFNFTVKDSPNGLVAGQCTSTNQNEYQPDTDIINKFLSGFGWAKIVIFVFIMVAIAVGLYFGMGQAVGKFIWVIIGFIEFIVMIIGAYIHVLNWVFVAMPVLILLLWIAWKVKEVFS